MIRTALEFIKAELEAYIVEREQDPTNYAFGNIVDLKSVVKPNGDIDITDTSHVTLMLVGVEEARREGKRPYFIPIENNEFAKLNPPVELELYLLFIAHNSDYKTALRDLSDVVSFFQANTVFDEKKYPALNAAVMDPLLKPWQLIERLSLQVHTFSFEQQNNLWAMLGSKFIPSILYKMNMLTVFETRSKEKTPPVTELNFTEN